MTRQERTSENPGREVAQRYRELMSVDGEWTLEHDDGFTWWAHRLAQRIRFSEAWNEDEFVLSRVSAETDFLLPIHEQQEKEFGFAMRLSAMSSAVRDPRTGVIRLRSAVLVHHATKAQVSRIFACAASIQVAMADLFADDC